MANARLEELRARFQENPRRFFAPFANELRKTGDRTQAISVCRSHLATQPGHVSGHIVLGQALYEAGESAEARTVFTAALELDPENLIALRTMGEIAQVNGEFGSARHWYERLLDADPRNTEVVQLLRDLPAEGRAPSSFAPPAEPPASAESPAPEATGSEKPAPLSSGFHTTYTGMAQAYAPREKYDHPPESFEPLEQSPALDHLLEPPAEHDAHAEAEPAPFSSEDVQAHDEIAQEAASLESFLAAPAPEATAPLPDESSAPVLDTGLDAPARDQAYPVEPPPASLEILAADRVGEPESPAEPELPRARFAEFGFEGAVDEKAGWATPSAAYSDPEAAPEDWFAETPASMEAGATEPATDSWFEQPEPAAEAESASVQQDEYWMPDFASVGADASAGDAGPPAAEAAPQAAVEVPYEASASMASAQPPDEPAPPRVEIEASADDAVFVEHPPEFEQPPEPAGVAPEFPDPAIGHTPSFTTAVQPSAMAPAPFVTETLAELYLQQGFRDEALAIYRQLAERDPADRSLKLRIEAIEHGSASDVVQAAESAGSPSRTPSVRTFFSRLASRSPADRRGAAPAQPAAQDVPFAAAASALANLFAASRPAPGDEGAASSLASAFTDPAGRPSRAADRELSLDHLFRDVPPGASGASGEMDEFFASPVPAAQPGSPAPSGEAPTREPGEGTDIRQFTAWLEGLRKK